MSRSLLPVLVLALLCRADFWDDVSDAASDATSWGSEAGGNAADAGWGAAGEAAAWSAGAASAAGEAAAPTVEWAGDNMGAAADDLSEAAAEKIEELGGDLERLCDACVGAVTVIQGHDVFDTGVDLKEVAKDGTEQGGDAAAQLYADTIMDGSGVDLQPSQFICPLTPFGYRPSCLAVGFAMQVACHAGIAHNREALAAELSPLVRDAWTQKGIEVAQAAAAGADAGSTQANLTLNDLIDTADAAIKDTLCGADKVMGRTLCKNQTVSLASMDPVALAAEPMCEMCAAIEGAIRAIPRDALPVTNATATLDERLDQVLNNLPGLVALAAPGVCAVLVPQLLSAACKPAPYIDDLCKIIIEEIGWENIDRELEQFQDSPPKDVCVKLKACVLDTSSAPTGFVAGLGVAAALAVALA